MRRIVPALACLLLVILAPDAEAQVRIGAYGGITSSSLSGDAPSKAEFRSRIGPVIGALVDFPVAENVWIGVQPGWVDRGYEDRLRR
jgi:hypothetical protein